MASADLDALREELARTLATQDGWQNPDALWTDNLSLISRGCEGTPVYRDCTADGEICNYACSGHSAPSPVTGEPERLHGFAIEGHDRKQTAWALVAKMAARIAELEAPADLALAEQEKGRG